MPKMKLKQLDQSGASDGQVVTWNNSNSAWEAAAGGGGGLSQWNEQNIVHVAPHGNDSNNGDAINLAKLTIASAITRATALSPSSTNRITILIHPGEYDEDNNTADAYVDFVGTDRDACILTHSTAGGAALGIVDNNVRVSNLTITRAASTGNYTFQVNAATGVEVNNVRMVMNGASNDEVSLLGASEVVFRNCLIEDVLNEGGRVLDDTVGGTYRFFNCVFKGEIAIVASYYFYGCHFQSDGTDAVISAVGSSTTFRMYGCTVRRSGSTSGDGVYLSSTVDWAIVGCDIDAAVGAGNDDVICAAENPGILDSCIIGTQVSETVKLKSNPHRRVGSSGGIDVYPSLQDAMNSLPVAGGVVELLEDYSAGTAGLDLRSGTTGHVVLEGNEFTLSGTSDWIEGVSGGIFELRNMTIDGLPVRLQAGCTIILRNVRMTNGSYVLIRSTATASSKIILDRCDIDGSSLGTAEHPIRCDTSNAAQVFLSNCSLTGRTSSGNAGAAVHFPTSGTVLKAVNTLFIHPSGTATDYEIDANSAVTVYTHNCMTRTNAIGDATNVTEGISSNGNIVDADAGFEWRF